MRPKNSLHSSVLNAVTGLWLKESEDLNPFGLDCDACSLAQARPQHHFRWSLYKCCTFQPFVANFLYGAALDEGVLLAALDPEKASYQALGVAATAKFRRLYDSTHEDDRQAAHLCSFYDRTSRRCGIWRFRPAECSTFFCANEAKRSASRKGLGEKASTLEAGLAQMALIHLGFSHRDVAAEVDRLNEPSEMAKSLDRDRAEDLYRSSWEWVKTLDESEVLTYGFG